MPSTQLQNNILKFVRRLEVKEDKKFVLLLVAIKFQQNPQVETCGLELEEWFNQTRTHILIDHPSEWASSKKPLHIAIAKGYKIAKGLHKISIMTTVRMTGKIVGRVLHGNIIGPFALLDIENIKNKTL